MNPHGARRLVETALQATLAASSPPEAALACARRGRRWLPEKPLWPDRLGAPAFRTVWYSMVGGRACRPPKPASSCTIFNRGLTGPAPERGPHRR